VTLAVPVSLALQVIGGSWETAVGQAAITSEPTGFGRDYWHPLRETVMPLIHDETVRTQLRKRVESLSPQAKRRWGKMSIDQMLWHCNEWLEMALGRHKPQEGRSAPIPKPMLKFMVLRLPWPKGAPTAPGFEAVKQHSFSTEKAKMLRLIDEIGTRDCAGSWPESPAFGKMSGKDWSHLMARHLDHHLKQFSA
jgi:hypothetical protein